MFDTDHSNKEDSSVSTPMCQSARHLCIKRHGTAQETRSHLSAHRDRDRRRKDTNREFSRQGEGGEQGNRKKGLGWIWYGKFQKFSDYNNVTADKHTKNVVLDSTSPSERNYRKYLMLRTSTFKVLYLRRLF